LPARMEPFMRSHLLSASVAALLSAVALSSTANSAPVATGLAGLHSASGIVQQADYYRDNDWRGEHRSWWWWRHHSDGDRGGWWWRHRHDRDDRHAWRDRDDRYDRYDGGRYDRRW
jgi:hypothetical protein